MSLLASWISTWSIHYVHPEYLLDSSTTCILSTYLIQWLIQTEQTAWPESASELYRPKDRRLSAKLVPTFADRRCHVVSATDPYGRILGFLEWCCYFFFHVVPQLYSRRWANPVPDSLLLRKSSSTGNRSRTSGFVARYSDH
jgi:hypothetical protein